MKTIHWALSKSAQLKAERGASFEDLLQSRLVGVKRHPGKANQTIMLFEYQDYIWVVPFVSQGDAIFLKTLFPSRKYTRLFKKGEIK